jgi:signal transduction histidine kinase
VPERFRVETLIDEVGAGVAPLVQERNNTLTVNCSDDAGVMFADRIKVRQILLNLLHNAATFTRNGWISLDARRLTVRGRETIQFSVIDTGVGMTRQKVEKIFEACKHVDPTTTRDDAATGPGLVIVSRFCDLMGGTVSVETNPGQGATFFVHIPADAVSYTDARVEDESPVSRGPRRQPLAPESAVGGARSVPAA